MKGTRTQMADRISELPEPILHHILSFVPFKQAARTCVLSKKWEEAWRSYPVFIIDDVFSTCYPDMKKIRETRIKLFNCLEQTLRNRHCKDLISMEKFQIQMTIFGGHEFVSFVDRCVCYAIASNVKSLKLIFVFGCCNDSEYYDLPPIVLCANSIEVLKLAGCKVELPRRSNVKLSSLRKLHMVDVDLDDHVFESLLAGCPLLEDLRLHSCYRLETLEFFGHDKLNDIDISGGLIKRVNIKTRSISSLTVVTDVERFEINIAYCMNLKNLKLEGVDIYDNRLCNIISELLLLESLCLWFCDAGKKLKISSASLKRLEIHECDDLVELTIDSPYLSHFTYVGDIINVRSKALALSSIDLSFSGQCGEEWSVKSVEFLAQFNGKEVGKECYVLFVELLAQFNGCSATLSLRRFGDEEIDASKELRQMLPSPLFNGEHLKIRLPDFNLSYSIAKVVDELLWIAPHTKTLSIELRRSRAGLRKTAFEFLYKKPLVSEGEYASCCKSLPILCWQHCIENVKVEVTNSGTKSYCLEGAQFLEKIDGLCGLNV